MTGVGCTTSIPITVHLYNPINPFLRSPIPPFFTSPFFRLLDSPHHKSTPIQPTQLSPLSPKTYTLYETHKLEASRKAKMSNMDGDSSAKTFEEGANSAMKGGSDMVEGVHESVNQTVWALSPSLPPILLLLLTAPSPCLPCPPHHFPLHSHAFPYVFLPSLLAPPLTLPPPPPLPQYPLSPCLSSLLPISLPHFPTPTPSPNSLPQLPPPTSPLHYSPYFPTPANLPTSSPPSARKPPAPAAPSSTPRTAASAKPSRPQAPSEVRRRRSVDLWIKTA